MILTIILSYAKTKREYDLTAECLRTLRAADPGVDLDIVVVETNTTLPDAPFAGTPLFGDARIRVVYPGREFGFNDFLQAGWDYLKDRDGEQVAILNNDLAFQPGSSSELLRALDRYDSVSPWAPGYHERLLTAQADFYEGYRTSYELAGWCLMFRREILARIPFDQLFPVDFKGWYGDNWYAHQLQEHGFTHALVRAAEVIHLGSQSMELIPADRREQETSGSKAIFDAKVRRSPQGRSPRQVTAATPAPVVARPHRRLKVAVYTIAKDEAKHAHRWARSAQDADVRLVADTGSKDGTVEALRDCGVTVPSIAVKPWRFDVARNAALMLLPADVDVCVSLDMDEVLNPGWREALEEIWVPGTTRAWHWFRFNLDSEYTINRIHGRHGYLWKWPVHELPHAVAGWQEVYADVGKRIVMTHQPDGGKSRSAYLPLLELAVQEDRCARLLYYLGREYFFQGHWQAAIDTLKQYLLHPGATWDAERCAAMRHAAVCSRQLEQPNEAVRWLKQACLEAPNLREPFCDLAQLYYDQRQFVQGYATALDALAVTTRPNHFLVSARCWGAWPHHLAAACAWDMGLETAAQQQVQQALRHAPHDQALQNLAALVGVREVA